MKTLDNLAFCLSVLTLRDLPDDGLPEICIAGRSNVGKSSLLNRLAGRKKLAKVSRQPGKTRALNFFKAGEAGYLVDLPGYGYAKISKGERQFFARLLDPYLHERKVLKGLIQLVDSRHGPVSGDHAMLDWLRAWNGSVLVVMTKADKLSGNQRRRVRDDFVKEYGFSNCILSSSQTGMGIDGIRSWIDETLR